jgi:hypothetical protein
MFKEIFLSEFLLLLKVIGACQPVIYSSLYPIERLDATARKGRKARYFQKHLRIFWNFWVRRKSFSWSLFQPIDRKIIGSAINIFIYS